MANPARRAATAAETLDTAAADLAPLLLLNALHQEEEQLEAGVQRLPTGLARLDERLGGGFSVPSLNVIGAAPKSGKSTLAQVVATHHVERGGVAYYLDLENGRRRFLRQVLCRKAELGAKEAAAALRDSRAGVFASRAQLGRWNAAKAWLVETLGARLFAEFSPPQDFPRRVEAVRAVAGERPVLVVIDSLQKLPQDFTDRRSSTDQWIRLFERLRHEQQVVFLVISEIKRDPKGGYTASESAFKETGGIEYAADLAMTLTRPRADEDGEAVSSLRVELARDCDDDPRGVVASYAPRFPFYGLEEREPVETKGPRRRGPTPDKSDAARDFLTSRLGDGPVAVDELLRDAAAAGFSRSLVYRVKGDLGICAATLNLRSAWRLP